MTTPRDLDVLADANRTGTAMRICDACGWYALMDHAGRCDPTAGRLAQQLIAAVPDVRAGQLGYGDDQVIFDLSDNFSVRFSVHRADRNERAFSLEEVCRLGPLTTEEAAGLVHAIKAWADAIAERRDVARRQPAQHAQGDAQNGAQDDD